MQNGKSLTTLVAAFMARQSHAKVLNTATDGQKLTLYDNVIAEWREDGLHITTAGWATETTMSRLSLLPGINVSHVGCEMFLNGQPWDGSSKRVKNAKGKDLVIRPSKQAAELYLGKVGRTKRGQMSHDAKRAAENRKARAAT